MTPSTAFLIVAFLVLAAVVVALGFARRATLLLTAKYLVKRRLAWVSLMAVALCVALVLIVFSVMGGWLQNFRNSFKTMTGDLIVSRSSVSTFAHYDEMIDAIERLPEVEAAIPVITTAGLMAIPTSSGQWTKYVGVVGLPPLDRVERVMSFKESLWYQHDVAEFEASKRPLREPASFSLWGDIPYRTLSPKDRQADRRPGMIVGALSIGVRVDQALGRPDWPEELNWRNARLTVLPTSDELGSASTINATTTPYWIIDGSRTEAPQHDNNVYVPFDQLQKDLKLTAYEYEDAATGRTLTQPAKTTEIHVRVRPGVEAVALKPRVQQIVNDIVRAHQPTSATTPAVPTTTGADQADADQAAPAGSFEIGALRVETWEEQQSDFLNAVENEITILMVLFGCVSLVAVFMIFCIFYTIVAEKTRDIGILKSVGASAWNVAQIFLTYGAAIGFVGGGLGVMLGWAFVRYINPIHGAITWATGREIYSSQIYAIDKLPNHVDPTVAVTIWAIGIFAAIVGAVLPATRAARLNPVESLRFE